MEFFVLLAGLMLIVAVISKISEAKNRKRLRREISDNWGKACGEEISVSNMKSIASYYSNSMEMKENERVIDDITWNDLEMDDVFKKLNSTYSTAGEECLYALLRMPSYENTELSERENLMDFYKNNPDKRLEIQYRLALLGKARGMHTSDLLFDGVESKRLRKPLYIMLVLFLFISVFTTVKIDLTAGVLMIMAFVLANSAIYHSTKSKIEQKLSILSYMVSMINTAHRISKIKCAGISDFMDKLAELCASVRKLGGKSFLMMNHIQDPMTDYIKMIFLIDLISYENFVGFFNKNKDTIRKIYELTGLIDSTAAIASYRESLDCYCIPQLTKVSSEGNLRIQTEALYHPLIKNPVPYSGEFGKSVLVTGSNASGKSTFLKAVAINAVFAQTIYTCLASSYSSPLFYIYTSMALKDNLLNNESYFIVELKSLKRITNALNSDMPCLCVIDEVLRGTNTVERIAASSEVLHYLAGRNCLCISATHDIELTSILEGIYRNFHFREEISSDNKITFNYRIHAGKSTSRNALKLLSIIGYDDTIVKNAMNRCEKFLEEGIWTL